MKTNLITFFTFFIIGISQGQEAIDHIIADGTSINFINSIFIVDLDNDGDDDIISTSEDTISWYENLNGSIDYGTRITLYNYSFVNNYKEVRAIDIDNDGDVDIIGEIEGGIVLLKSIDGQGNFELPEEILNGMYAIEVGDINNDGDGDVLGKINGTIVWMKYNHTTETFGDPINIGTGSNPLLGDITGDGDLDVVISSTGDVKWYENNGDAGFGTAQTITTSSSEGWTIQGRNTRIADIDSDGDLDVLITRQYDFDTDTNSSLSWWKNDGGNFTFGASVDLGSAVITGVNVADLDGDLDIDVIYTDVYDDIHKVENIGNGAFPNNELISNSDDIEESYFITTADIDSDGDQDIVLPITEAGSTNSFIRNKIIWFENLDGIGSFAPSAIINNAVDYLKSAFLFDLDNDGDLDALSGNSKSNKLAWYENIDGNGTFDSQRLIDGHAEETSQIGVGDFNGDGHNDVIRYTYTVATNNGILGWYPDTDGNQNFGELIIIEDNVGIANLIIDDLDGDGDPDILCNRLNEITWYKNNDGAGNFSAPIFISDDITFLRDLHVVDVDGDLDLDIFSASETDNKIAWYENTDGLGDFGSQQVISIDELGATSVTTGDIDGDGDQDVLSLTLVDETVAWYENLDGAGDFGPQQIISYNIDLGHTVLSADMDNDGDIDVITTSRGDAEIVWYENQDGQGDFSGKRVLANYIGEVIYTGLGDIDNDGDIDFLSGVRAFEDSQVVWHENTHILATEDHESSDFYLYPNPTNYTFDIKSNEIVIKLSIHNYLGQEIMVINDSEGISQVNIQNLNKGIYIVKLTNSLGINSVRKLVKK